MGDRGEHIYCSFCGRSNDEAGKMLVKADRQVQNRQVKICLECAQLAVNALIAEPPRSDKQFRGVIHLQTGRPVEAAGTGGVPASEQPRRPHFYYSPGIRCPRGGLFRAW